MTSKIDDRAVSVTGVKTIIMLAIALVVVYAFDVDILASLITVYREKPMDGDYSCLEAPVQASIKANGAAIRRLASWPA